MGKGSKEAGHQPEHAHPVGGEPPAPGALTYCRRCEGAGTEVMPVERIFPVRLVLTLQVRDRFPGDASDKARSELLAWLQPSELDWLTDTPTIEEG